MKPQRVIEGFRGFALIDLVFVILIVVAAVLLLPLHPARTKTKAFKIRCVYNLKQIGAAFRDWVPAGEKAQEPTRLPMTFSTNKGGALEFTAAGDVFRIFQVLSNQLTNTQILICPSDKRKIAKNIASLKNENLSYFVGLDADETMPQMFLAGDRNLTNNGVPARNGVATIRTTNTIGWNASMHNCLGGVLLVDGSVQGFTSSGVQSAASQTGTNVMRLVFP